MLNNLQKELKSNSNKKQAEILQKFFKTGKGEYGEGDVFLGIKVPVLRNISKKYNLNLKEIEILLNSKIHEERLVALFILIRKYLVSSDKKRKEIFNFYIDNSEKINNWDLVDLSAPNIVGDYLLDKNKIKLYELSKSKNVWKRRISIVSTISFIRKNNFLDTIRISEILLKDEHPLIHKGVGWMLREVGKRNLSLLKAFLKKNYKKMPRVMLRYSIEKFDLEERKKWMKK
jgi:3-methyladenine DNA glycosylase AlkD